MFTRLVVPASGQNSADFSSLDSSYWYIVVGDNQGILLITFFKGDRSDGAIHGRLSRKLSS